MKIRTVAAAALFGMVVLGLSRPATAQVVWVGGVSSDVFDEANWDLSASSVTVIDPNVSVSDNIVIGPGPFANGPVIPEVDAQQRLQLADGFTFTLDGATLNAAGNDGVGGEAGSMNGPTVQVINGAAFNPFFVVNDVKVFIDATSSARFGGGGNPINLSTIDLAVGATLAFVNEPPANYLAEHLSKTTVNGVPAVDGVNITVVGDGASGSIITAVPEPSSMLLGLLAIGGLLATRRR